MSDQSPHNNDPDKVATPAPTVTDRVRGIVSNGRRGDLIPGIRVPLSLIGPLWSIIAGLAGLWYSNEQARNDAAVEAVALRKDVSSLVNQVSDMRTRLELYYPKTDAVRDAAIVDLKIQNIDKRVTTLENKASK